MLRRLIFDAKYHLKEIYESLKLSIEKPGPVYPLVNSEVPGLQDKIDTLEQQYALAKEARRILRRP
jgi:hypothetical protein